MKRKGRNHSPMFKAKVAVAALVGLTAVWPTVIRAEERLEPPQTGIVSRIQGRTFERFRLGEGGEIEKHDLISFGELVPREAGCELPIHITSYDPTDGSRAKKDTEMAVLIEDCEPHFVANILTIAGESENQTIQAKVVGHGTFYPAEPRDGLDLPDLHYVVKPKSVLLSALGTTTNVLLADRRVKVLSWTISPDPKPLKYEIRCTIKVSVLLLGLHLKSWNFLSRQVLQMGRGLTEEILDHENGARTIFRAVPPAVENSWRPDTRREVPTAMKVNPPQRTPTRM